MDKKKVWIPKMLIALMLACFFNVFHVDASPTLAIFPFESENEPQLATTAADLWQAALFQSKAVSLIERQKLDVLVKEQSLSLIGLTTTDANRIGNLLNADLVCLGKLNRQKEGFALSTRIVDIKTGDIKFSDTVQFAIPNQLKEAIQVQHDSFILQLEDHLSAPSQQDLLKRKQRLLVDPEARTPRGALLRSTLFPGLGQFYNKQTFPGVAFIAAEGFMTIGLIMKMAEITPPTGEITAPASVIGLSLGVLHVLNIVHAYAFSPYHKNNKSFSFQMSPNGETRTTLLYSILWKARF
jgi:TolB-like protein